MAETNEASSSPPSLSLPLSVVVFLGCFSFAFFVFQLQHRQPQESWIAEGLLYEKKKKKKTKDKGKERKKYLRKQQQKNDQVLQR